MLAKEINAIKQLTKHLTLKDLLKSTLKLASIQKSKSKQVLFNHFLKDLNKLKEKDKRLVY